MQTRRHHRDTTAARTAELQISAAARLFTCLVFLTLAITAMSQFVSSMPAFGTEGASLWHGEQFGLDRSTH